MEEVLNHRPFGGSINRRVSPRYQFEVDIEIEWGLKIVWGRVENISREGMFIELDDDVPEAGEQFTGNLSLNVPLRVIGLVRRTVPHYGIGVSFVIPEPADQRRFAALLVALAEGSDPQTTGAELPEAKPDEPLCCVASATQRP